MRTNSCLKEILSGVSSKLDEIETTGEKKTEQIKSVRVNQRRQTTESTKIYFLSLFKTIGKGIQSLKLRKQFCSPISPECAKQFISPERKKQKKIAIAFHIKLS